MAISVSEKACPANGALCACPRAIYLFVSLGLAFPFINTQSYDQQSVTMQASNATTALRRQQKRKASKVHRVPSLAPSRVIRSVALAQLMRSNCLQKTFTPSLICHFRFSISECPVRRLDKASDHLLRQRTSVSVLRKRGRGREREKAVYFSFLMNH